MVLVYTTQQGRIKPSKEVESPPQGDGIVRIKRQTKGRKGAGVTIINGLELEAAPLAALAKELKTKLGVGGTIKDWEILINGDCREAVKKMLEDKGFKVKLAGG